MSPNSIDTEQGISLRKRSRWLPDEATDQMGAPGSGIGLTSISIEFFRHQDGNYHLRQSFYQLNGRGNPLSFGWETIPDFAFTIAGRLLHDHRTREHANDLARAWEKETDGEFKPRSIWIFVNRSLLVYEPCGDYVAPQRIHET